MKSIFLSLLIIGMIIPLKGNAASLNCQIESRPQDVFFAQLPKETLGYVKCDMKDLNIFYVSELKDSTREALIDFIKRYEHAVSPGTYKLVIMNEEGTLSRGISMKIESQREFGSSVHYLTSVPVGDASLVYLYTDGSARALASSAIIKKAQKLLASPAFVSDALQKLR
jgi:hypothetical protein